MTTIYADYQATTPVDPRVVEKMAPYWGKLFGNPHSGDHSVGWQAHQAICESTLSVATLIGADADEVVFTSGATEANNLALFGLAKRAPADRQRILVSAIEHKCTMAAAHALSTHEDFVVETIPVDKQGFLDLSVLEKLLDQNVLVLSVMAVNNEIGTIQHIQEISELLVPHGVLFHCDAAQAPCAMDISNLAKYTDLLCLSAHKMYGPQGIGALYISRVLHEHVEPLIYGGEQQHGLRAGTVPLPLCVGMAAAAEIMQTDDAAAERSQIRQRRDTFIRLLGNSQFDIILNGPVDNCRHPGNANVRFDNFSARDILDTLQPKLSASTGAACTSGISEPSHVLRALGLSAAQCDASIRFSFGRFTTDKEVDMAAQLVLEALNSLSR